MDKLDVLMSALDMGIWELSEAFQGMPDEDLWKRPHPKLLSVGELAMHIAYGEDNNVTGGTSLSPIVQDDARYYSVSLEHPVVMDMGAEAVYKEVERVHDKVKAALAALSPDPEETNPHRPDWTWHQTLEYMVFHVAYHTGQIYSVRHLLGHETVDN